MTVEVAQDEPRRIAGTGVETRESLPQIVDPVANVGCPGYDGRRFEEFEDHRLIDNALHSERNGCRHSDSELEKELIGIRRRRLGQEGVTD